WGHSSNVVGVELCQMARVKHLCLFHHEPIFDDARLAGMLRETRRLEEITRGAHRLEISAAYDGLEIAGRSFAVTGSRPPRDPAVFSARPPAHWSERGWLRALRGRRGRPLGFSVLAVLLALLWSGESRPVRPMRLAGFDWYQALWPRSRVS